MKKIKFPLEMKDGHLVRELEEFQEFFDLKKAVEYFANGKLQKWLENNYNDDILEELQNLTGEEPNFVECLTKALGVNIGNDPIDVCEIFRETGIKERLKKVLREEEAEQAVGCTAMNQEELENLVENGHKKIYLLSGQFILKKNMEDLELIGIEEPTLEIEEKELGKFYKQKIRISGKIKLDDEMGITLPLDLEDEIMLGFLDLMEGYLKKMLEEITC